VVGDEFFSERQICSAKILEGASPDAPKIFGSAGALPSRKTIRRRFQFGSNLVFQFRPPTEVGGYEMKPAKAG
jgi:hypothetical protein